MGQERVNDRQAVIDAAIDKYLTYVAPADRARTEEFLRGKFLDSNNETVTADTALAEIQQWSGTQLPGTMTNEQKADAVKAISNAASNAHSVAASFDTEAYGEYIAGRSAQIEADKAAQEDQERVNDRQVVIDAAIDKYLTYVAPADKAEAEESLRAQFADSSNETRTAGTALAEIQSWSGTQLPDTMTSEQKTDAIKAISNAASNAHSVATFDTAAYGEYAAGMSTRIAADKAAQILEDKNTTKMMISNEQSQGKDLDGDGKVGYVKLADFEKKDVKGAFDKKQAELQAAIQQDGPDSGALAQYNQSVKDESNVKKAVVAVETKIEDNKAPGAWAGVPKSIAQAEQRDTNSQLQQEKAKVQEFGVAVAGMTPAEREDLNKFFTMAKDDPEGTKKFVQSAQAKEKQVALVDEQIKANTVASFGNAVPKGVAQAEQRDANAQLQQEKAAIVAAPLNPDVNPAYVSSMNPTGSIQKDKELKAFFAGVKKEEDAKKAAAQVQAQADKEEQQWLASKKAAPPKKPSGGTTAITNNDPMPYPPAKPASTIKMKYM